MANSRSQYDPKPPSTPPWRLTEWVVASAIVAAAVIWVGAFNTLRRGPLELKPVAIQTAVSRPVASNDFIISLDVPHQIFYDSLPITADELRTKLTEAAGRETPPRVVIRATHDIPAADVQKALDLCKDSGLEKISFSAIAVPAPTAQSISTSQNTHGH